MADTKLLTSRQEEIVNRVLQDVDSAKSIDAKQVLEESKSDNVQFANPALQPIAFAIKYATLKTYVYGIMGEIAAWLMLVFSLAFLLVAIAIGLALRHFIGVAPNIPYLELLKKSIYALMRGRWVARRQRYNAYKKLLSDKRAPVLYLRSFSSHYEYGYGDDIKRLDERLAEDYEKYGPVLAVAEPGATKFMPGPVRLYFDNDNWQAGVMYLMSISQLVIIHCGITDGTLWELGMARHRLKSEPEKLMLYLTDVYSAIGTNPNLLRDYSYYHDFKVYAEHVMDCELPRRPSIHVKFDKNWDALVYGQDGQWLHAKTVEKQSRWQSCNNLIQIRASMTGLYESCWGTVGTTEKSVQSKDVLAWLRGTGDLVKQATDIRVRIIETATLIVSSFRRTQSLLKLLEQAMYFDVLENYKDIFYSDSMLDESSRMRLSEKLREVFDRELQLIDALAIYLQKEISEDNVDFVQAAPNNGMHPTPRHVASHAR